MLSVEPYGMKLASFWSDNAPTGTLSVLSVEPYGMKHACIPERPDDVHLSVLSVEPYGMKLANDVVVQVAQAIFQCSRSSRMG